MDTPFALLEGHLYINLTTFRENGDPVPTAVWFAEENGVIYVTTRVESGKVKRIKHTARVDVAPCTIDGQPLGDTSVEGVARILEDSGEREIARAALKHKYDPRWTEVTAQTPDNLRVFLEIASGGWDNS